MKEDMPVFYQKVWQYFEDQFVEAINSTVEWIPQDIAEYVAEKGLEVALDITYDLTKKFSGSYFFEEMQGIADATNYSYETIRRIHMIGELTKASCSMFGAWGNATAGNKNL